MTEKTPWTPGPWVQFYDEGKPAAILPAGRDCAICYFCNPAPSRADASLIAAAPDLYDALVSALRQLEEYEVDRSGEEYNDTQINAALAKARGET